MSGIEELHLVFLSKRRGSCKSDQDSTKRQFQRMSNTFDSVNLYWKGVASPSFQ